MGCSVVDAEEPSATATPEFDRSGLTHGLGLVNITCSFTDAGGLSDRDTDSYTIADTGDPTITPSVSPAAPNGSNGWYKTSPTVTFSCDDSGGSGVASCLADGETTNSKTVGNGANQTIAGTATDYAGNSDTAQVSGLNVDSSAPNAPTATLDPVPNSAGWNNSNVVVDFEAAGDNGPSGIASCTADVPVSTETASQTVTGTCTDNAGNVSQPTQVTVKLDRTGPSISDTVTVDGTTGDNSWYKSDVEVTFTGTDSLSGPATATQSVTSLGEGSKVQVQSPAFTDVAGNTTAAGAVTKSYKIDKSDPTATFDSTIGSVYFGSVPSAPTCTASDAVSGPANCTVTGYSTAVGTHTLTATATDNAGRTATATQSYTVKPWETKGYYQPVDMNGVWNTVKGGGTVPLKFELFAGANGTNELTNTSAVSSFVAKAVACPGASAPVDEIETVLTGGTSLRYDGTAGQFVQNWETPKKPGTCATATITAQDGSTITANFSLK